MFKTLMFFLFVENNKIIFGFRKNTIVETVVPLYIMHVLCCPASCLPRQQIVRKTSKLYYIVKRYTCKV
jgi:hypothetical protein